MNTDFELVTVTILGDEPDPEKEYYYVGGERVQVFSIPKKPDSEDLENFKL